MVFSRRALTSFLAIVFLSPTFAMAQEEDPIKKVGEDKIKLSFSNQMWLPLIEHFAEETGFSLQKVNEPPPGTFNYKSDREFTPMEALDLLNTALVREGYTLIRYKRMLVLRPIGDIPDQLIEEITPEELSERGRFEVLRCLYDLDGLEDTDLEEDIRRLVNPDYEDSFQYVQAAKKLYVKETVDRLRTIQKLLDETRRRSIASNTVYRTYRMKHVTPEDLLAIERQFLGMEEDANQLPDGSLKFAVQPLGDKIYLSGTAARIEQFLKAAEMVDVKEEIDSDVVIEKPFIRTYQVLTMPEIVFKVLQTILEGRDAVKMEQDTENGTIVVQGRAEDHELVVETIAELSNASPGFAFVQVKEADADVVAEKLRALFGQSLLEEGGKQGPMIYTDLDLNQILIRGTPQEVNLAKQMIEKMDIRDTYTDGPRTTERFIEMNLDEQDDIMSFLPEAWGSGGRENRLNIVMPEERLIPNSRTPSLPIMRRPSQDRIPAGEQTPDTRRKQGETSKSGADADGKGASRSQRRNRPASFFRKAGAISSVHLMPSMALTGVLFSPFQETTEEASKRDREYQPPQEVESKPGAPITVKAGKFGIRIISDDLDALDDLEDLIRSRLNREGVVQRPTLIPLEHVSVEEALSKLEAVLGIDSGGGGGGGGLGGVGNMMANVASNAMGGAAGDLLGGLLGGGDSSGGASMELEGDVRFSIDVRLNTLFVSGATDNDLEFIYELINFIDREEAPQEINTLGKTYDIPILHRDPEEVKGIVETQLPSLFKSAAGASGGGQNAQAQAQVAMMRQMQQMLGGGRNNQRGSNDPEAEKPKATLGVDTRRRSLLVTGPEHIYLQVLDVVNKVDREELSEPQSMGILNMAGEGDAEAMANLLKNLLGDKAIISDDMTSGNNANSANRTNRPTNQTRANPMQIPAADFMRAIQQQRARANAGNRGGATRGGTPRGGGGRGGRGGR